MKKIKVEDAVGTVLAHDITEIVPGKFKGVGFKKGHIVREADVPQLIKIGKRHLYILDLPEDRLHEDVAALRIAKAISGDNLRWTDPREGKSKIVSRKNGLLKINISGLLKINKLDNIVVATLKTGVSCQKDQTIAATRIIPLTIPVEKIEVLESIAQSMGPILEVIPYHNMRVGGLVTGSEIYNGLIKDEFEPFVAKKIMDYGCEFVKKIIVPDDVEKICQAILELKERGCELILTTGGLSVDPDDVTKKGVRKSGAKILFYGSPVLPGAMFLYAELNGTKILGLPACVYYHRITLFDIILPRVLAEQKITKDDIAGMGHGGLCMNCEVCHYPACAFGK